MPNVRIADNRPAARSRGYLSGYDLDDEEKQGARDATDLPSTPGGGGQISCRIGVRPP